MGRNRALAATFINTFFAIATLAVSLMGACNAFLGPEPDTDPHAALRSLWNDFNEIHAYIDIRMSYNQTFTSWDEVYEHYKKELLSIIPEGSANSDRDGGRLFYVCCKMLGELKDPHVSLAAPSGNFYWYSGDDIQKIEEGWFNISVIKRYYLEGEETGKGNFFTYGRFKPPNNNIGYIYIESFMDNDKFEQQDWAREIDKITKYFQDNVIDALVIDIRNNSGGSGPIAEYIAAHFASVQKNYMKASAKNGPGRNDFAAPMTFRVKPEGTRFTKPIALLTNRATVSAAEWFVMAMRTQGHVTHVGTPTHGAFSPKTARPMINGWYYTISAFRVTDIDGNCYEGRGISPDLKYIFRGGLEEGDTAGERRDTQLDMVLEIIPEIVRKWKNP
jgi:hypothetical protein